MTDKPLPKPPKFDKTKEAFLEWGELQGYPEVPVLGSFNRFICRRISDRKSFIINAFVTYIKIAQDSKGRYLLLRTSPPIPGFTEADEDFRVEMVGFRPAKNYPNLQAGI